MFQDKLKTLNASIKQKDILELEKKYFEILYKIFSANTFKTELNAIMQNINANWKVIHEVWAKPNVVDLAVERHINFRVYNDPSLKGHIKAIYPSVISSDTAFVTDDAVINIDSKTTNVETNYGDWKTQLVGSNQASFDNKNYFPPRKKGVSVKPTILLQPYYGGKPVLSFFLSTLYHSDKVNKIDTWYNDASHKVKPYNKDNEKVETRTISKKPWRTNIKFSCVPHKDLSSLYDHDIVCGVKGYIPPDSPNPIGTKSVRIKHEILKERLDSNGVPWEGFKNWQI